MERAPVLEEEEQEASEAEIEARGLARVADAMMTFYQGRMKLLELDNQELQKENEQLKQETEQLRELAYKDSLTGAKNTRALHESFERRKMESEGKCVLMLVDANQFKPINDTYGHAAGDAVLKEIVTYLEGLARPGDTVARIGGDEFAVLFTNTSEEEIKKRFAAEQLHKIVVDFEGNELAVTLSAGFATPEGGEGVEALLHRADNKMYKNKRERGDAR